MSSSTVEHNFSDGVAAIFLVIGWFYAIKLRYFEVFVNPLKNSGRISRWVYGYSTPCCGCRGKILKRELELDTYDLQLLDAVQADASVPQSVLGEKVSLSTAAVNRRLKRLRDAGVIQKQGAVLSPAALGYPLTIVALVEAESERIDRLDAMKAAFRACPQVQQCYYVTGEWDFVLIFLVSEMAQYTALSRHLFFKSNNVKRFKSLVSMDWIKVTLDVPVHANARRTTTETQQ